MSSRTGDNLFLFLFDFGIRMARMKGEVEIDIVFTFFFLNLEQSGLTDNAQSLNTVRTGQFWYQGGGAGS